MADKKSLSLFGLIFGLVTGLVMLVAAVTVQAQIDAGPGLMGPSAHADAVTAKQ
jgi:hypothetical protein